MHALKNDQILELSRVLSALFVSCEA